MAAAQAALQDILKQDRQHGYWRTIGISSAAALLLLGFGFAAGWHTNRVLGIERTIQDLQSAGVVAEAAKNSADALNAMPSKSPAA